MGPPGAAGAPVVLRLEEVTKSYSIQERASPRLGAWMVNKLFEHLRRARFDALHGVTLEVRAGEMVGLLGANGSGKSTVLKLAAGIVRPDSGTVRARGRIAAMLELGIGFHPELSGMENIFYNGALMGLRREEVLARLGEIIAFSGLENFLDEPVKHYSSGMHARLACSVALHLEPDIVLVDEILAVGDAEFQQRGMVRLLDIHHRGAAVVLVTHVLAMARDMAQRLVWLDAGRVRLDGEPRPVARAYHRFMADRAIPASSFLHARFGGGEDARRDGDPRLVAARLETPAGDALGEVETGSPCRLRFAVDPGAAREPWRLHFAVRWSDGRVLFEDASPPQAAGTTEVDYEVDRWPLLRNDMEMAAALVSAGEPVRLLHREAVLLRFRTTSDPCVKLEDAVCSPAATWAVEPAP